MATTDTPAGGGPAHGRRLRVLYLIDFVSLAGGAERFALGVATHLPPDRFDVWMCSTRQDEPSAVEALERAGVTYINLARRARWDVLRFRALVKLLRTHEFDVIHSHMFGSNAWGVIFGRMCRVPVVLAHEHNWSYSGDRWRVWIDRHLIARFATRYIAVSQSNFEQMVTIERIPADKILVLPTAYIPHEAAGELDLRSLLGLPNDAQIVMTAANLRVEKALEVLIEALAIVSRSRPQAHLVIVGDGPCRAELEQLTASLGVLERVHFMGRRNDVDSIVRNADICAMSSDWEGMPLFALEAMAAAKPLVATRVGGMPEIVGSGETGTLVPPRNPPALAEAIIELLSDPELRARLGEGAAARLGNLTIESVTERFATLYEELFAESSITGAPGAALAAQRSAPDVERAGGNRKPANRRKPQADVLALCYHACSPDWTAALSVTPAALEYQVRYLMGQGWQPATFLDAIVNPTSQRTLAITFDDGFASVKHHALPVLARLGAPATLFVPTAFPDRRQHLSWPGLESWPDGPSGTEFTLLSWDEIRELADQGWEIGSHSHSHSRMPELSDAELERELVESRDLIATELGRPCLTIAYPYGATDSRVAEAAVRAGYVAGASLSRSLENLGPARYPRVGIYHRDGPALFRLKAASATRRLRASRLFFAQNAKS